MNGIALRTTRIFSLLLLLLLQQGCGSREVDPSVGDKSVEADDHAHAGDDEANSIELSDSALKNVGFQPYTVVLMPFAKENSVPAIVVERPGRTQIDVTAPMTGIVTRVYQIEGESVGPGEPLFNLRLTHEDLVASQRDFLRSVEELDILDRELARLRSVSEGIIAGKHIIDREYAKQKLEAALLSFSESLLLHGLSAEQVDTIRSSRKLLKELTVYAPNTTVDCSKSGIRHPFTVQSLLVNPGQQVESGDSLCVLGDHCRLYLEGKAFEADAPQLAKATEENQPVVVVRLAEGKDVTAQEKLSILYLSDSVDPESRAFHFYMELPNKILHDSRRDGHQFIDWKYKPAHR